MAPEAGLVALRAGRGADDPIIAQDDTRTDIEAAVRTCRSMSTRIPTRASPGQILVVDDSLRCTQQAGHVGSFSDSRGSRGTVVCTRLLRPLGGGTQRGGGDRGSDCCAPGD